MWDLIIDTDIGNDCDDAAAVALACRYAAAGDCGLLCFTVNTADAYAADCIDAIAAANGVSADVGVYRGAGFPANPASYCRAVAERFGAVRGKRREEAVALMRRKLAESADKSVKIVCIGQLNDLRALLESKADEFGADGAELVRRKVGEVVVMGGMFGEKSVMFNGAPYTAEFNIATAVPDSVRALELCPADVVFCDFLLGYDVITLEKLAEKDKEDPVGYAYKLFCGGGRPSWDILTVMYAVRGAGSEFCLSPRGRVKVNGQGQTEFKEGGNGPHRILRAATDKRLLKERIHALFGV